jgi:competence protein ComEC
MRRTPVRWQLLPLLILASAALWLSLRGLPDGNLHVWFLDVGQGDAILIQAPGGEQILVDGGPSPIALLNEISDILPFWDRTVDLVILTHADADHLNGLIPFLQRYHVPTVLDAVHGNGRNEWAWADAVKAAGSNRTLAERGMRLKVGDTQLTVFHPAAGCSGEGTDNNNSVVVRLDYEETSFLLTGDAEHPAESEMLLGGLDLEVDVLKVGHHGSEAASSPDFIAAIRPSLAIISVGAENDYGHPREEVLERLSNVPILRTDLNGRVEVVSDGDHLWSHTEK